MVSSSLWGKMYPFHICDACRVLQNRLWVMAHMVYRCCCGEYRKMKIASYHGFQSCLVLYKSIRHMYNKSNIAMSPNTHTHTHTFKYVRTKSSAMWRSHSQIEQGHKGKAEKLSAMKSYHLPRCEVSSTLAPLLIKYCMVGMDPLMRVSSVMVESFRGTFKSHRTSTLE